MHSSSFLSFPLWLVPETWAAYFLRARVFVFSFFFALVSHHWVLPVPPTLLHPRLRLLATFAPALRRWFFRLLRVQLSLATVGFFLVPLALALLRPLQCDFSADRHLYTGSACAPLLS